MFWNKIVSFFKKFFSLDRKVKVLTYYVPGPPNRKSGYREKELDKYIYAYLEKGHELINIQTQTHQSDKANGMWVVCTVRSKNKDCDKYLSDFDVNELNSENIQQEQINQVAGIYPLEN